MKATGLKRPTPVGQAASASPAPARSSAAAEAVPDNDPIALTMVQRKALGGEGNQCTDAEAQKKKFKVFRAPKLTQKGPIFVDLIDGGANGPKSAAGNAGSAAKSRIAKPTTTATRPVTAKVPKKSAAGASSEATSVSVNENLEGVDDPIAISMQDR